MGSFKVMMLRAGSREKKKAKQASWLLWLVQKGVGAKSSSAAGPHASHKEIGGVKADLDHIRSYCTKPAISAPERFLVHMTSSIILCTCRYGLAQKLPLDASSKEGRTMRDPRKLILAYTQRAVPITLLPRPAGRGGSPRARTTTTCTHTQAKIIIKPSCATKHLHNIEV